MNHPWCIEKTEESVYVYRWGNPHAPNNNKPYNGWLHGRPADWVEENYNKSDWENMRNRFGEPHLLLVKIADFLSVQEVVFKSEDVIEFIPIT